MRVQSLAGTCELPSGGARWFRLGETGGNGLVVPRFKIWASQLTAHAPRVDAVGFVLGLFAEDGDVEAVVYGGEFEFVGLEVVEAGGAFFGEGGVVVVDGLVGAADGLG